MAKKSEKLATMSEEELNARHAEKMKKKKAARDKIIATKTREKGLVIVQRCPLKVSSECKNTLGASQVITYPGPVGNVVVFKNIT